MMTITEDYVSYEVAKLLKDKGFEEECQTVYFNDTLIDYTMFGFCDGELISAPTLQMAMKWLREVHKLSIEPYYNIVLYWAVDIKYIGKYTNYKEFEEVRSQTYNSYEEAVEAAIKYCLEKLI